MNGERTRGVVCPYCKSLQTHVIDSRSGGTTVRRRRECLGCTHRQALVDIVRDLKDLTRKVEYLLPEEGA